VPGGNTLTGITRPDAAAPVEQPRLQFAANLDILRSIAVLLVLLAHGLEVARAKHVGLTFPGYDLCAGRLGVLLFFVHTSLVLNFSLSRLGASGWVLFRTFLVRRALRVYPLSVVCVLLVFAFKVPPMPFQPPLEQYSWGLLLSNLALTMNLTSYKPVLTPLWSLPIEVQMYVALPVIFTLLGPTRSPRVALVIWVLASAVAWMQLSIADYLTVIDYAPCFMAGVVAYTLSGWSPRRLPALLWMPFLLAILCGFAIVQGFAPEGLYNMPLEWVFCLAIGLAIPLFHDSTATVVNYAAHLLARYSYGIYLFHCIALWIGCRLLGGLPEPLQWAIAVAATGVMSVASYHLLEKPAIELGARLNRKPDTRLPQYSN